MKFSFSSVSMFLRCPYSYYLSKERRLQRKRPERPLTFGGDYHKLLECRYDKKKLIQAKQEIRDKFLNLDYRSQEQIGEDYLSQLFQIFGDYRKIYKNDPKPDLLEKKFKLLIGNYKGEDLFFTGIIDELYFGEEYKIGEHKTFSRRPDMSYLVMNPQPVLYAKAVQFKTGKLPTKVIWDYIKSEPAKLPVWLDKSNRFSEASNSQITPYSWNRANKLQGTYNEESIKRGEELYGGNLTNYFFKVEFGIHPEMVKEVWNTFVYNCKRIMVEKDRNRVKVVTKDCNWCDFKDICYTEFTGGDVEYVIAKDYVIKPRKEKK